MDFINSFSNNSSWWSIYFYKQFMIRKWVVINLLINCHIVRLWGNTNTHNNLTQKAPVMSSTTTLVNFFLWFLKETPAPKSSQCSESALHGWYIYAQQYQHNLVGLLHSKAIKNYLLRLIWKNSTREPFYRKKSEDFPTEYFSRTFYFFMPSVHKCFI